MNTTVNARPKAENGVENETLLDNRLEALLSRMDRLAASVEKSGVTIYQRRLNTSDIANPGKGFFGFFWVLGYEEQLLFLWKLLDIVMDLA